MKPINVKSSTYIEFGVENKDKDPKFGDHVRISKYKYIWAKGYKNVRNKKKLRMLFRGHMLLVILTMKKLLELFIEKN